MTYEKLNDTFSILEKGIKKLETIKRNRIEFAYEPQNNIDQIKKIWNCFFDNFNKIDIAIECAELTPHEIIEISKSFQHKFEMIKQLARSEIIKREKRRQDELN